MVASRSATISHTADDLIGAIMSVTVADNDIARLLIKAVGDESVTEGDTVDYTVKLNSSPGPALSDTVDRTRGQH